MAPSLSTEEWIRLIRKVFRPRDTERGLALLVDVPDERVPDNHEWADRRSMVADWHRTLSAARADLGLSRVSLVAYRNARRNNADLPPEGWLIDPGSVPDDADRIDGTRQTMERVLTEHALVIAATELSATAPLKLQAKRLGFRAATMPGFTREMLPTLRLDWEEIHDRCTRLKERLDPSVAAEIVFRAEGRESRLLLDLRHRTATASGGLVTEPGTAGNLPSGETYIVPYEGERTDDPSRTAGELPARIDGELLRYRIEQNRAVDVTGRGPVADRERREIADEPAYANLAELGLGLLSDYGIRPVGRILLDEKLALHIAFGRSDHFGGQVGAARFSSPDKVIHIDRVYLSEMQPGIEVLSVDLLGEDERPRPLMREGRYV
jgi:leucyl aminopeptidase (aminopeptidase T)